jgi:hypothetical protein
MSGWWLIASLVAQVPAPQTVATPAARPGNLVIRGEVSALAVTYPKQEDTRELRTRALLDMTASPKPWLRLRLEGTAEVLLADRRGSVDDAIAAVRDAWAEVRLNDLEIRAGYGRLVWGRLDEVMPSDVINPIDTATFFLEGRAAARLPVAFVRSRVFFPGDTSIEAVVALPGRRGRFDRLDEETSPFNLTRDLVLPAGVPGSRIERQSIPAAWGNLQGGVRVSTTARRIDMSVSAWRGFEGFGLLRFVPVMFPAGPGPTPTVVGKLVESYPRFTMIAADAETVRGGWAIRGEVAGFVDKSLDGPSGPVKGKAIDAGVGVDRSAGDYHLFGSLVWHREWSSASSSYTREHLNVIASVDRRFSRERYLVRVFGVANPEDRSGFVRGLASWSVRDNLMLEGSGGAFIGQGTDTIGKFADRDFVSVRIRYQF